MIITTRISNTCSLETLTLKVKHHSSTTSGLSSQCSRNCWSGKINICWLFGVHADPSSMSARIIMSCTVPCHMSWLHCAGCLQHAADACDITSTTQITQTIHITRYETIWLVCRHLRECNTILGYFYLRGSFGVLVHVRKLKEIILYIWCQHAHTNLHENRSTGQAFTWHIILLEEFYIKTREAKYENVTLRRVQATTVAVEKQWVLHNLSVYL